MTSAIWRCGTPPDFSLVPLPVSGLCGGPVRRSDGWHTALRTHLLVVSRIVWGFIGSYHARFSFPGRTKTYYSVHQGAQRSNRSQSTGSAVDNSLLGLFWPRASPACSVLMPSGGPLAYVSDGDFIDIATEWHEIGESLQALIASHLLAIAFYQFKRRQRLIQVMWFGSSETRQGWSGEVAPACAHVLAVAAGCLWLAITMAPEPPRWY